MGKVFLRDWCAAVPDAYRLPAGEEGGDAAVLQGGDAGAGELCGVQCGDYLVPHLLPGGAGECAAVGTQGAGFLCDSVWLVY